MGEDSIRGSPAPTTAVFKKPYSTLNRNVFLAQNLRSTTQQEKRLQEEIQEEFSKISAKEWSAMDEIDAPSIDEHRSIISYSMEIRREVEEAYEDANRDEFDEEDAIESMGSLRDRLVEFNMKEAIHSWPRFVEFRRLIRSIPADSPMPVLQLKSALVKLQLYHFQKLEISKPKGSDKAWNQTISETIATLKVHLLILKRTIKRMDLPNERKNTLVEKYKPKIVYDVNTILRF
ncbi:hypothetical protein JCM3765_004320 [Sporobolomyces pararoseus]